MTDRSIPDGSSAELPPGVTWNGIHSDRRNSDTLPFSPAVNRHEVGHVLAGRTVLFGLSIGPDGRRYVTTGQAGDGTRLHIFDADGTPLDEHADDRARPGSRVCADVPVFDRSGRCFVSDDRRTWCFDADGRLVWSADLGAHGARGGPVSTIVTADGLVGGVTMMGQVFLLDAETGGLARPVLDLEAGDGFPAGRRIPGLWDDDMMDATTVQIIKPGFFGFGYPVTCSPAVGPDGLVYVPAVTTTNDGSELLVLDTSGTEITIVSRTPIPGRCTASSSVSADGRLVYTVDGTGLVHAIDAHNGGVVWTVPGGGAAASPAIGPDGTVYSTSTGPSSELLAITDGRIRWRRGFDDVATRHLPNRDGGELFPDPTPIGAANSVQTVGTRAMLLVVVVGYGFQPPTARSVLLQPHRSLLVTIGTATGDVLDEVPVRDSSEAVVVAEPDGTVHVCHAALLTSIAMTFNELLPEHLRTDMRPVGGITTLRPI